ncbi:hypothetical protein GCM10022242_00300 [Nocardioides panacisoli]|uniref:Uncharacterized protein n=1 Tax=Nocardioides panacisoli TaxID=627624 RepID=A0ABP7HPP4_9ACTN
MVRRPIHPDLRPGAVPLERLRVGDNGIHATGDRYPTEGGGWRDLSGLVMNRARTEAAAVTALGRRGLGAPSLPHGGA